MLIEVERVSSSGCLIGILPQRGQHPSRRLRRVVTGVVVEHDVDLLGLVGENAGGSAILSSSFSG